MLAAFAPDAEMAFEGVAAGAFVGREAIAAAYTAQPPTDEVLLLGPIREEDGRTVADYAWAVDGVRAGRMVLSARDGLVTRLVVTFEPAPQRLRPLTEADVPVVERLWQLYSHDMSEIRGTLPNQEGLYRPGRLATYLRNPDDVDGYLIWHREAPAGFAFVFGPSGELRKMGDFFVVRAARRQGVGNEVVGQLFARYRGPWEIGFQGNNRGAPEFWRRVVTAVVGTDWREERRPVPDKPHIPDDHFILFTLDGGPA
jgi:predicted acetyltransferase